MIYWNQNEQLPICCLIEIHVCFGRNHSDIAQFFTLLGEQEWSYQDWVLSVRDYLVNSLLTLQTDLKWYNVGLGCCSVLLWGKTVFKLGTPNQPGWMILWTKKGWGRETLLPRTKTLGRAHACRAMQTQNRWLQPQPSYNSLHHIIFG